MDRILEYARHGPARFLSDPMLQDAIVRRFEVVGEASKQISPAFRKSNPEIPWSDFSGFRDILIHGYETVSANRVWDIVEGPLRRLRRELETVRKRQRW
ncbi:MAG: DUF86 domain-containing protein [Euryarchaeota archaeon]|nr:DUF86 domain-containing protein [Euryarchaeota archaeon]